MRPETPLIEFFRHVYAPLKLPRQRSEAQDCQNAIEALTSSLGRDATIADLMRLDPPAALAAMQEYARNLGSPAVNGRKRRERFREVIYRRRRIMVPIGEPTPHEIEREAAKIRAGWSDEELRARTGKDRFAVTTWLPPGVERSAIAPEYPEASQIGQQSSSTHIGEERE